MFILITEIKVADTYADRNVANFLFKLLTFHVDNVEIFNFQSVFLIRLNFCSALFF